MKIIIQKNIALLRNKNSDDMIIKALFDKVVSTEPSSCILNSKKEILIRNYGISKIQNRWVRHNPIMLGINMWSLITSAKIKINDKNDSIVYEIDTTRIVFAYSVIIFLSGFLPFFATFKGTSNMVNAIKIGGICFGIVTLFSGTELLYKYLTHKNLIKDFIDNTTIQEK